MSICLEKCFLQHVFGVVVVLGDLFRHAEHTAIVMLDQFGKGGGISGSGALDQGGFIENGRCGDSTHAGGPFSLAIPTHIGGKCSIGRPWLGGLTLRRYVPPASLERQIGSRRICESHSCADSPLGGLVVLRGAGGRSGRPG